MTTPVKSIFLDKVEELPPVKMPTTVSKDIMRAGKRITVQVPRKAK